MGAIPDDRAYKGGSRNFDERTGTYKPGPFDIPKEAPPTWGSLTPQQPPTWGTPSQALPSLRQYPTSVNKYGYGFRRPNNYTPMYPSLYYANLNQHRQAMGYTTPTPVPVTEEPPPKAEEPKPKEEAKPEEPVYEGLDYIYKGMWDRHTGGLTMTPEEYRKQAMQYQTYGNPNSIGIVNPPPYVGMGQMRFDPTLSPVDAMANHGYWTPSGFNSMGVRGQYMTWKDKATGTTKYGIFDPYTRKLLKELSAADLNALDYGADGSGKGSVFSWEWSDPYKSVGGEGSGGGGD